MEEIFAVTEDENSILKDGEVVAEFKENDEADQCDMCMFNEGTCLDIPCSHRDRIDGREGYFKPTQL